MDLKNFIIQAVRDIVEAGNQLENDLGREIHLKESNHEHITFDIGVEVCESQASGAGLKISVIGGGIGKEQSELKTHRMKFSFYVNPKTKEQATNTKLT